MEKSSSFRLTGMRVNVLYFSQTETINGYKSKHKISHEMKQKTSTNCTQIGIAFSQLLQKQNEFVLRMNSAKPSLIHNGQPKRTSRKKLKFDSKKYIKSFNTAHKTAFQVLQKSYKIFF